MGREDYKFHGCLISFTQISEVPPYCPSSRISDTSCPGGSNTDLISCLCRMQKQLHEVRSVSSN